MESHGKVRWEAQGLREQKLTGRELDSHVDCWEQGTGGGGRTGVSGTYLDAGGGMSGKPNILTTESARGRSE